MAQRPVPRLYSPIGEFGRRGKELSVERLEREAETILKAVGTEDELADWYKRRDLAVRVEALLRSIVASINDPVDRRIAEAVLATEDEFVDKTVERRKQLLYEENGITEDQFKERRPHVVAHLAVALEDALAKAVAPESVDSPNLHADSHAVSMRTEPGVIAPERNTGTPGSRTRTRRRRLIITKATAAILVLLGIAGVVALTHVNASRDPWNGMTPAELERRYDGKLPWGDDDVSRCSDPPPSQVVPNATTPPVMGPGGPQVGVLQLRMSPICPTVVWARVLWNGDERATYRTPAGWSLHVVMKRTATNSELDEPEPSSASDIPYVVGRMIASARACVYAEAFFASGTMPPTAPARTSCVRV